MANVKIISQRTGEFISEDDNEPGVLVNMDDANSENFIAKLRGDAWKPKVKGKPPMKEVAPPLEIEGKAVVEPEIEDAEPTAKVASKIKK